MTGEGSLGLLDDADLSTWDEVAALAPDGFAAVLEVQRTMWDRVDPVLLELARLRLAQLLRAPIVAHSERARAAGLVPAKTEALAQWPTSPLFDERERACLTLTEQYLLDVNGVSDEQVDDVLRYLSPAQCHAFVSALWAFEQLQRMCLVLGITPPPDQLGLAGSPGAGEEREEQR